MRRLGRKRKATGLARCGKETGWAGGEDGSMDGEVEEKRGSACCRPSSSRSFVCSRCGGKIRWGWRLDLLASPSVGHPPVKNHFLAPHCRELETFLLAGLAFFSIGLPFPLPGSLFHHPLESSLVLIDRRPRKIDQALNGRQSMNRIPIETALGPDDKSKMTRREVMFQNNEVWGRCPPSALRPAPPRPRETTTAYRLGRLSFCSLQHCRGR